MSQRLNLPQQLIRLISEPAFVIDQKAGIYAVNHAACDTLNFSCEELLQMHFAEIDHNLSEDDWHNNWQTSKQNETSSHNTLYNNARGEQIAVQVNQHFIHHDDQEYLCVIASRTLAAQSAQGNEIERLTHQHAANDDHAASCLEIPGVILISLDTEARVQMINQTGCEILGYCEDDILQQNWFEKFLPESHQAINRAYFRESMSGRIRANSNYENLIRTRSGELRNIMWNSALLTDAEGKVTGMLASGTDITEMRQAEQQLEKVKQEWNYAMDYVDDAIYLLDLERRVIRANKAFYRLTNTSEQDVVGRNITELMHIRGEHIQCPVCQAQEACEEAVIILETGEQGNPMPFPIEVICNITHGPAGEPYGILVTIRDLSRIRQTQEKLFQSQAVFQNTNEGIMIVDVNSNIIAVNPAFTRITGYSEQEAVGKNPRLLHSGQNNEAFYAALWADLNRTGGWQGEIWNRRKNGEVYPEWLTISTVRDDNGKVLNYIGVFSDISQLKQSQSRLEFLAHHDPLTTLPNRLLFSVRAEHAIERSQRNKLITAILFIDLDRFKHINDSLGHTIGDRLLKAVAKRLQALIRNEDTIARLGGDEFVILLEELHEGEDAAILADKVKHALSTPFHINDYELFVCASIGISLYPLDGKGVEELLRNADSAMYRAKDMGRNTYEFYTQELTAHALEHVVLEAQLRKAIEQDQLRVFYQPQICLINHSVIGVEALVRWQHPEQGLIGPHQFIPVAEDTSLIIPLGEWVLRHACKQAKQWLDEGVEFGQVAVNVAGPQILQSNLVDTVASALNDSGLPPEYLLLEITETFIMDRAKPAIQMLLSLRKMGVSLAIDDFGTGYSSLAYLKELPVNKLKIDKSFINDLPNDDNDAAITRAMIALGDSLLFSIIAEGVETEAQREFLVQEGCEQVQGYLYSKPVPADELVQFIEKQNHQRKQ